MFLCRLGGKVVLLFRAIPVVFQDGDQGRAVFIWYRHFLVHPFHSAAVYCQFDDIEWYTRIPA